MIGVVMADDDQVEVLDPSGAERVDDVMGRSGVNQRGLSLGEADWELNGVNWELNGVNSTLEFTI